MNLYRNIRKWFYKSYGTHQDNGSLCTEKYIIESKCKHCEEKILKPNNESVYWFAKQDYIFTLMKEL